MCTCVYIYTHFSLKYEFVQKPLTFVHPYKILQELLVLFSNTLPIIYFIKLKLMSKLGVAWKT